MKFFEYLLISTVLLVKGAAGQLTLFPMPETSNHGTAIEILQESTSQKWIIQTIRVAQNLSISEARIHVYNHSLTQKLHSYLIDTSSMIQPVRLFEFRGRTWIASYKISNTILFTSKGSNEVRLQRLSPDLSSIDTSIYVVFQDSLFFVDCEIANNQIHMYGLFRGPLSPVNPQEVSALQIIKLNQQLQIVEDTVLNRRNNLPTTGNITGIFSLNEHQFAVSGVGQTAWIINSDTFRTGVADIAVYNRSNSLLFNSVIHPNPLSTFPLNDLGPRTAPYFNVGFIKDPLHQNYYYKGTGFDSTYPVGLDSFPVFGMQKQYLAKLNSQFQVIQRHFFGHPRRNDIPPREKAFTLGPNGRLYSLSNVNQAAWLVVPDSIQTLVVYSVDTQFNNPQFLYWNDGNDVISTEFATTPSGIYILANSVGRGGEKFHVLRIEGTAWASSSSQQVWPEWGLFPNPARERVFISGEMPSNIGLHDMQGRLIHHWQNTESNELQLPALPPGIYLLHGSNAQGQRWPVRKLVVR